MKHIPMSRRGAVTVKLPPLSGGVNLYDTPTEAADNQLTACDNMWWHKGALRTRPGVRAIRLDLPNQPATQTVSEREQLFYDYDNGRLAAHYMNLSGKSRQFIGTYGLATAPESVIGFRAPINAEQKWYFLLSDGKTLQGTLPGTALLDTEPYIPTVLINGYGSKERPTGAVCGDLYEDYNMLTPAFKCQFTTDGESVYWQLPDKNLAAVLNEDWYANIKLTLARSQENSNECEIITVDAIRSQTGYEVALKPRDLGYPEEDFRDDIVLYITIEPISGVVCTKLYAGQNPMPEGYTNALPRVVNNNLEITAWRGDGKTKQRRDTICKMTRCAWYGGTRSGLGGGTRLFVCGNPDEPNLLHWSDVNKPLYFPEHNYARIGDASQAITAFGKQGELLILYKEHQMYAMQYEAADEADYAFAEQGGVAYTTYAAQFPVTPLHDSIGCDCPDTLRLVNNRLVWANSNGHVYMLTAVNQFSERNVRDISRNITAAMAEQGDTLKTAVAGEYEGYYLLAAGERVYLLDTQNSAFASFNHYSSEDNARKALPWYIWTLPFTVRGMLSDGYRVVMIPTAEDVLYEFGGEADSLLIDDEDTIEETPIAAHFATKMFDFNMPDRTKSVGQMYIGMDVAPDGRLALTYQSEKGSRRDPYEIDGGIMAAVCRQGCMRYMRLTPQMNLVQTFGLQADVIGAVAVDGITIKVKQQGVVR